MTAIGMFSKPPYEAYVEASISAAAHRVTSMFPHLDVEATLGRLLAMAS